MQHWLVGNIAGCDFRLGQTLSQYVGAAPGEGTGAHRFVFLLFAQPSPLNFNEPMLDFSLTGRPSFDIRAFAQKYQLVLYGGNFFTAEFDDSVPSLLSALGA